MHSISFWVSSVNDYLFPATFWFVCVFWSACRSSFSSSASSFQEHFMLISMPFAAPCAVCEGCNFMSVDSKENCKIFTHNSTL
jgi:hypothetical protein